MLKTILMTGVTSFTGSHIARALCDAGYEVLGVLTKERVSYQSAGVSERIEYSRVKDWIDEAPFGSHRFLDTIRTYRPALFVNHGVWIEGYRSFEFDYLKSLNQALNQFRQTMELLREHDCRGVIYTGSIFEGEEDPSGKKLPVSPYGWVKGTLWDAHHFFCRSFDLSLGKVVIPNPVGPFENEDRLIPTFVKTWKKGEVARIENSGANIDFLPAPWLARRYVELSEELFQGRVREVPLVLRPSGYVNSVGVFVRDLFLQKLKESANVDYRDLLEVGQGESSFSRVNSDPCPERESSEEEQLFWSEWFRSLSLM